jgi:hypothetical protein
MIPKNLSVQFVVETVFYSVATCPSVPSRNLTESTMHSILTGSTGKRTPGPGQQDPLLGGRTLAVANAARRAHVPAPLKALAVKSACHVALEDFIHQYFPE